MRTPAFLPLLIALLLPLYSLGQPARELARKPDPKRPLLVVETSCGECKFGLPGEGCDVAVRLPKDDGTTQALYVDGVAIDEYGHPHDANGFCLTVHKAEVQGDVVDGRFKASYFNLLPLEKAAPAGKSGTESR
ncbi:MAG: hypothetical protein GFGODING_03213 [Flavobacteriales bacterium]|nr:hypothetical protein [Flavobacteriales bacterium]